MEFMSTYGSADDENRSLVETMWSRIPKDALTDLVPKIKPSRLQELLINPAISQLQIIYKEFFTSKKCR